jgi:hypothetical protein
MSFDPDKPFNDLPLLPPQAELETKAGAKESDRSQQRPSRPEGRGGSDSGWAYVRQTNMLRKRVQKNRFFGQIPEICPRRGHFLGGTRDFLA